MPTILCALAHLYTISWYKHIYYIHTIVSVAAAGVNLTVTNTHSHTCKITHIYTYSLTHTHKHTKSYTRAYMRILTRFACVCARALGTWTSPACYISENRNGPTVGRPLSQSLISMCFFSSLFIFLSYFTFFIRLPLCYRLTTVSDRALYLYTYIHTRRMCTAQIPCQRDTRAHIIIMMTYIFLHIYMYCTAGWLTFGQHDPIVNFFYQINSCILTDTW